MKSIGKYSTSLWHLCYLPKGIIFLTLLWEHHILAEVQGSPRSGHLFLCAYVSLPPEITYAVFTMGDILLPAFIVNCEQPVLFTEADLKLPSGTLLPVWSSLVFLPFSGPLLRHIALCFILQCFRADLLSLPFDKVLENTAVFWYLCPTVSGMRSVTRLAPIFWRPAMQLQPCLTGMSEIPASLLLLSSALTLVQRGRVAGVEMTRKVEKQMLKERSAILLSGKGRTEARQQKHLMTKILYEFTVGHTEDICWMQQPDVRTLNWLFQD